MSSSKTPLTYRIATLEDALHLSHLINSAFRSEKTGQTWLYDSQEKRVDIAPVSLIQDFISGSDTIMLIGSQPSSASSGASDPRVATCYVRKPSTDPEQYPHVTFGAAWLGFLAVAPGMHGQGYGKAMLCEAERFVKEEWGASRLEIDFVDTRLELKKWYQSMGYEETGKTRPFVYGENGREILRDGLSMVVLGKDLR